MNGRLRPVMFWAVKHRNMFALDGWRVLDAFNKTLSRSCCVRTRWGMHFVIKTFRVCWGRYEAERGCMSYNPSLSPQIYQQWLQNPLLNIAVIMVLVKVSDTWISFKICVAISFVLLLETTSLIRNCRSSDVLDSNLISIFNRNVPKYFVITGTTVCLLQCKLCVKPL